MAHDSTAYSHQEWIGYVQPVGVVVSTPALLEAGAAINRNSVPLHRAFLAVLPQDRDGNPIPELTSFSAFATDVLNWQPGDLAAPPDRFAIPLPGYDDLLQPTWVVNDGDTPVLLILETNDDFDQDPAPEHRRWNATPQSRFERLQCTSQAGIGTEAGQGKGAFASSFRSIQLPAMNIVGPIPCSIALQRPFAKCSDVCLATVTTAWLFVHVPTPYLSCRLFFRDRSAGAHH